MNIWQWLKPKKPLAKTSTTSRYDISLSGTQLCFDEPEKLNYNKKTPHYARPADKRPFVNTESKGEYYFLHDDQWGCCHFYRGEYTLPASEVLRKNKQADFTLDLILSTPSGQFFTKNQNFFMASHALAWVQRRHAHLNRLKNSFSINTLADGTLEINMDEELSVNNVVSDDSPIPITSFDLSGLQAYKIPHERGFTIAVPIDIRDVVEFEFCIHDAYFDDAQQSAQHITQLNSIIKALISSVTIQLSEKAYTHQRALTQ